MNSRLRPKLSYSNVIATVALFVALGGAAIAAGLPKNSVGPKQLKRGAVTTPKLRKGAVTSGKLAPKSVVAGKLGPSSVTPGNIGDGAVTTPKLATNAVIASTIRNSSVTTNKLNNEAVTTAKLGKGSVTLAKLADDVAPLLGTLKSGQTLRGYFALGQSPNGVGDTLTDSYSFQFPLVNAPLGTPANIIDLTASPVFTPVCPGVTGANQQTPEAAAGNLCVYITGKSNLGAPPLAFVNGPTRLGFALQAKAGGLTSGFEAVGQWAVTAP